MILKIRKVPIFFSDAPFVYQYYAEHGMALRISLNSHVCRVYASDPVHNTPWQAKLACANAAIKEGVIAFIQFGNGQTEPTKAVDNGVENLDIRSDTPPPPTTGITLQDFFDTLPKPFPEDISERGPNNTPTWLNLTLQSARGARLVSSFIPIIDNVRHRKLDTTLFVMRSCYNFTSSWQHPSNRAT